MRPKLEDRITLASDRRVLKEVFKKEWVRVGTLEMSGLIYLAVQLADCSTM